jgi:MoaA/NifB/PqqE/SkfB family radical SAM enzyme
VAAKSARPIEGGARGLAERIPLATPLVLFVDPASVCNFRCRFCPTGDRGLIAESGCAQGTMSFPLFTKIIDDLSAFDERLCVLRLYKEGEPLLNKRLPDMIRHAKASGRVETVDTTTNGFLLTPETSLRLVDAGLDALTISVDGVSDEMFWQVTQTRVDFAAFVENVRFFYEHRGRCKLRVRIPEHILTDDDARRFFATFMPIADHVAFDNLTPCWPEFDMESRMKDLVIDGRFHAPTGDRDACPYIFYSLSIASDGTASICFVDWARKLAVGDVGTMSLKEIWQGDALYAHQIAHLRGERRKNPVCAGCGQLNHCSPDDIDPFREELAAKLVAERPVTMAKAGPRALPIL